MFENVAMIITPCIVLLLFNCPHLLATQLPGPQEFIFESQVARMEPGSYSINNYKHTKVEVFLK